jgi:hypothetical protein
MHDHVLEVLRQLVAESSCVVRVVPRSWKQKTETAISRKERDSCTQERMPVVSAKRKVISKERINNAQSVLLQGTRQSVQREIRRICDDFVESFGSLRRPIEKIDSPNDSRISIGRSRNWIEVQRANLFAGNSLTNKRSNERSAADTRLKKSLVGSRI